MREFAEARFADRRIRLNHSTTSLDQGGARAARHQFGVLTSYAAALGLTFDQLFDGRVTSAPADDVAAVAGTLTAAGGTVHLDRLCRALRLKPERVRAAGEHSRRLGCGSPSTPMCPSPCTSTLRSCRRSLTCRVRTSPHAGLTREQARLLVTVATAGTANQSDRLKTATALVDAGLLEYVKRPARTTRHGTRAALRLTKSARFDLVLD